MACLLHTFRNSGRAYSPLDIRFVLKNNGFALLQCPYLALYPKMLKINGSYIHMYGVFRENINN